ncbi:hypothetical protein BDF14DRAFT_1724451 [Spinellus fusiger]|nr:hypothetical protein BDF14DRAFT_1724451 [Spinellus fusiger]
MGSCNLHHPSVTKRALQTYENITANLYCGSATGRSIAEESMPCECKYDPMTDDAAAACGDDDACINRLMFMECMVEDCHCGQYCRNRRFQRCHYAKVDVIQTEKKGFGLRSLADLPANAFIMEYIGEVIPNHEFVRRTREYEAEGLKHYYFMTLKTDEIIDATKRGCLARFINHSCRPNSVTQKWVVGKTMRIGIFTTRAVKAGDEFTFDYKFERYGAVAQKCYCGEACCKGYIGGALASDPPMEERGHPTDEDSDSEQAVTLAQKRSLKKRSRPPQPLQDPEEVQSFVKKMLDSVGKAHLVNRLLLRLELTNPDNSMGREVLRNFVRLHGLKMLKFWLGEWKGDHAIVAKVLCVLERLPLANRNGLEDCKMFDVLHRLMLHPSTTISALAKRLEKEWRLLKSVYRIPKRGVIPVETSRRLEQEVCSQKRARFISTREYFDPDDDYFEYLSLNVTLQEIEWKLRFPPRPLIPTAPRAMLGSNPSLSSYQEVGLSIREAKFRYIPSTTIGSPTYGSDLYYDEGYHLSLSYQEPYPCITESSLYEPPPPQTRKLPTDWRSTSTEEGTVYYYNLITRKSQWAFPEASEASVEKGTCNEQREEQREQSHLVPRKKKCLDQESATSPTFSHMNKTHLSPHITTPTVSLSESADAQSVGEEVHGPFFNDVDLKKEVGKIVTKYMSARQQSLWKGDKEVFKNLARKITHHVVDKELQSGRRMSSVTSAFRAKIEKFIDMHGVDFALKLKSRKE